MKKLIVTMLLTAMTVSMAACGNSNTASTESVSTETSIETTVETAEETEISTEETAAEEASTETEAEAAEGTTGEILLTDFQALMAENAEMTTQELADAIIENKIIEFGPATAPVEAGLLTGFGNEEITGFEEATMFAPVIGTIPFVGYIFELGADADVEAFKTTLSESANLRWNVCTEADEMVVESVNNTVFFLMCPKSLNE